MVTPPGNVLVGAPPTTGWWPPYETSLRAVRLREHSGVVTEPRLSYLVAATQRSGSTLLCRALTDTDVAGRPEEYFLCGPPDAFPPGWTFWEDGLFAQGHDNLDREGYLELVFELGTTTNGVFGAKLMWNNVPCVLDKLWELPRFRGLDRAATFHALLPNLRVIHLVRRDRVRQAVSWARAAQEGVWVVSDCAGDASRGAGVRLRLHQRPGGPARGG
jgi:trehalose 2-sulfotransferase